MRAERSARWSSSVAAGDCAFVSSSGSTFAIAVSRRFNVSTVCCHRPLAAWTCAANGLVPAPATGRTHACSSSTTGFGSDANVPANRATPGSPPASAAPMRSPRNESRSLEPIAPDALRG